MSRSNSSKNENITVSDIMSYTNMGKDVFERELGNINSKKNISSPFRVDKNPSARVKPSKTSGIWLLTDYTEGTSYTAIKFIEKLYNLSFQEAIDKISWDFGIKKAIENNKEHNRIVIPEKNIEIPDQKILYEYEGCKFNKKAHNYWNAGELTEDFLRSKDVYRVCKIGINRKVVKIPDDELCFVYEPNDPDEDGLKFLRIGKTVLPQDKWRTNISNMYLWNHHKYVDKKVKDLFVVKSRKDELILELLGYEAISTMSENWQILDMNMPKIIPVAKNIIINYGSDEDGVNKCKIVQQKYNTKYFNTPKNLVNNSIDDNFSYVSNFGLKSFDNLIKNKFKNI